MSDKSASKKENVETIDIEKKRELLEELNVPPQVIKFIKKNSRNLQIVAVCIVVAILAWTAYDYYREAQKDSSTALLQTALKETDSEKRDQLLNDVATQYSGTDAALWSRLELAHNAYDGGKLDEAATKYESVLKSLSSSNPLSPLVLYSLAQTYEASKEIDKALGAYTRLIKYTGFAAEGHLGSGRMYEKKGDLQQARASYEKIKDVTGVPEPIMDWVADKLTKLPAGKEVAE
jgi:predicted negative regulator of RcsB-dependent stress response